MCRVPRCYITFGIQSNNASHFQFTSYITTDIQNWADERGKKLFVSMARMRHFSIIVLCFAHSMKRDIASFLFFCFVFGMQMKLYAFCRWYLLKKQWNDSQYDFEGILVIIDEQVRSSPALQLYIAPLTPSIMLVFSCWLSLIISRTYQNTLG